MWQASHYNTLGTEMGLVIAHRGWTTQMAGELARIPQKSSGHGIKAPCDRSDPAFWGGYQ